MRTLLKNAFIFGDNNQREAVNILIEKRSIVDIYKTEREISAANVIDMTGQYVLPGFINAHVHLFGYPDGFNKQEMQKWIRAGFTTLRDEGVHTRHTTEDAVRFRDECAKDPSLPTLHVCGRFISGPNGYGGLSSICVEDEAQARDAVRRQYEAGVNHIKLSLEDGYNLWTSTQPKLSPAVVRAICDEAHRYGLKVSAHVTQAKNLRSILTCGLDDLSHTPTPTLPEEQIEEMIKLGILLIPTLTNFAEFSSRVNYDIFQFIEANLRSFVEMGGTVAFGNNHIQTVEPWFNVGMPMMEVSLMLRAGMTIEQVIASLTSGAALALGLPRHGKVKKDYIADLVAIPGNPYEIPLLLTGVQFVMKEGVVIKYHELKQYSTFF